MRFPPNQKITRHVCMDGNVEMQPSLEEELGSFQGNFTSFLSRTAAARRAAGPEDKAEPHIWGCTAGLGQLCSSDGVTRD